VHCDDDEHPKILFMDRRAISPPRDRRTQEMKESSSKVFEQNAPTLFSTPTKGKYSARS
jgi:hypothetical protein